ncbi:MAG TPA: Maf family nucleotide pyrophosphatase [Chitinophagaceae bacterium]|nr:Maf family nucleotide pyrophosphatase [Chitinophagaceae bacterium]
MGILLSDPLILASGSPRRSQLLRQAGISFRTRVPAVEETFPLGMDGQEIPACLAEKKAWSVKPSCGPQDIILAADTLVFLDGRIIGKPSYREDAIQMLGNLSGRMHRVITGVCILHREKKTLFSAVTEVYFRELDPADIIYYVDHYHPLDKAGAYGIQEWIGLVGIERICGSYFNVMGLPVSQVIGQLRSLSGE